MKQIIISALLLGLSAVTAFGQGDVRAANEISSAERAERSETAREEYVPLPPVNPDWFRLDEIRFDLGLEAEFRRRNVRTNGQTTTTRAFQQNNKSQRFEETLGTWGTGAIGGDRWLKFDFAARFGLTQERYAESRPGPDLATSPTGEILQYDLQAILFPAGKLSATLFAFQQDDRVPRAFLPSRDRRRERYGIDLSYNDPVLPMRLRFEDNYEMYSGSGRNLIDDESRSEKRLAFEATWHMTDNQQLQLTYDYSDQRDRYSGTRQTFATTRNYLTLHHTLQFGPEGRSRLETIARFNDESGDLARDVYEIAPRLRLHHSDTLSTHYQFQYYEDSFFQTGTTVYRGDIGFDWNPGNALGLAGNIFAMRQNVDSFGETSEWGGTATLSHRRENEIGALTASMTYARSEQHTTSDDRFGYVTREAVTFRDPYPASLAQTEIDPSSLVVTDVDRRRVYTPSVDYIVVTIARAIQLVRVRNGRIVDGQSVLVSYRFDRTPELRVGRDRIDLRFQQDFAKAWAVYYAGSLQFERIDTTLQPSYLPRDINRHRVSLRVRKPRWAASAEFEINQDSIDPYQAFHLTGDVQLLAKPEDTLALHASFSHLHFFGARALQARNTSLLDTGVTYRHLFGPESEFNAAAAFRYEDDSLFGKTHGVDLSAGLFWRIGLFTASVEAEYDVLRLPNSRDEGFLFWFRLRREIPLFARS